MYAQVEKPKENSFPTNRQESRAVANTIARKKSDVKQSSGFVDNRPEAIAQRKLQEIESNSPHISQLRSFSEVLSYKSNKKYTGQLQRFSENNHLRNVVQRMDNGEENPPALPERMAGIAYLYHGTSRNAGVSIAGSTLGPAAAGAGLGGGDRSREGILSMSTTMGGAAPGGGRGPGIILRVAVGDVPMSTHSWYEAGGTTEVRTRVGIAPAVLRWSWWVMPRGQTRTWRPMDELTLNSRP
jgi:hypothetical protein